MSVCLIVLLIVMLIVGFTLLKWGIKILFYPIITLTHQVSLGKWGWFSITVLCMIPGYVLSYIPAIFFELFIAEHVEEKQMHQEYRRLESKLERNKKAHPHSNQHIIKMINSYILKTPELGKNPFYLATTIPSKKLNNARSSFALNVNRKDVVYFIDLTVWGSGKKGVLFTGKSIYWDDDDSKCSIDYSEISDFEKTGGPAILLNSEKLNLYMVNNKEQREIIFDMIRDIIEADKKNREKKQSHKKKGNIMSKERINSIYNKLKKGVFDKTLTRDAGMKDHELEVIHLAFRQYGEKYGFWKDMMKDKTNVHDWIDYFYKTELRSKKSIKDDWIDDDGWIEDDDWMYETEKTRDVERDYNEEEENSDWN